MVRFYSIERSSLVRPLAYYLLIARRGLSTSSSTRVHVCDVAERRRVEFATHVGEQERNASVHAEIVYSKLCKRLPSIVL